MPAPADSAAIAPGVPAMMQSHVRFIVAAITILAMTCAILGAFLMWKGYAGGELLAAQVSTAIGGLLTMLSQRPQGLPPAAPTLNASLSAPSQEPGQPGASLSVNTNPPNPT